MAKNRTMAAKNDKAKRCACCEAISREYSILAGGFDLHPAVTWAMNHKPDYYTRKPVAK